ncbi:DNA-binding transcriptional regulator, IclR family [Halopenitus malekzadehii]|uniref:DNA-binding transcriptional regulator, IclR family n=1 Tax=Halopenitus malekzadehii TaxID=1267564 RepID=A0A1H6I837_9EURY|nr:IclR family transcriptional regulator [Halopenitus malekzadehii]SEH42908.1 DNA-binding transcriptional regulator, IclR family [Halopenitus malekzadehii]
MTSEANDGRHLRTVRNAVEIVESLKRHNGARVTDLAAEFDVSDGTMHTYLNTLRADGLVYKEDGEYRLTLEWFTLGTELRERIPVYRHGTGPADDLARRTGDLVYLAVEQRGRVYYLYPTRGADAPEPATSVGTVRPLHAVSAGKVLLAAMPDEKREHVLEELTFEPVTEKTIVDRDEFREELERITEQGYALNDEEEFLGSRTVATSIAHPDRGVAGAICASGPKTRFDDDYITDLLPSLKETANRIEINIQRSDPVHSE